MSQYINSPRRTDGSDQLPPAPESAHLLQGAQSPLAKTFVSTTNSDTLRSPQSNTFIVDNSPNGSTTSVNDIINQINHTTDASASDIRFRKLLLISYSLLLAFSLIGLAISGFTTLWSSTLFIGAAAGFSSVPFSIIMLVFCSRSVLPAPAAQTLSATLRGHRSSPRLPPAPPSSSLGAVVCGAILTLLWVVATAILIVVHVGLSRLDVEITGLEAYKRFRGPLFGELAAVIVALGCSILVSTVQFLQRRHFQKLSLSQSIWTNF